MTNDIIEPSIVYKESVDSRIRKERINEKLLVFDFHNFIIDEFPKNSYISPINQIRNICIQLINYPVVIPKATKDPKETWHNDKVKAFDILKEKFSDYFDVIDQVYSDFIIPYRIQDVEIFSEENIRLEVWDNKKIGLSVNTEGQKQHLRDVTCIIFQSLFSHGVFPENITINDVSLMISEMYGFSPKKVRNRLTGYSYSKELSKKSLNDAHEIFTEITERLSSSIKGK